VNQTTAATLCRMSGNGLLQLSEKWTWRCKKV
jgi:hypothetical protein